MQVQVIPPKALRKARKQETARYVVKWIVADTMYFQWFKRDSAACAFLNRLLEDGVEARILMK
jgi:hypothetical protein